MRGHRHGERHPVGRCGFNCFAEPGANRPVGDLPDACLLDSAASLITSFKRNFQRGHHHLQLTDIVRIRKRYQPVSLTADGRTASRSGGFFCPLFECGQLHERVGRCHGKITPGQGQCFVNTGAGVPQGSKKHLAVKVGHIVEQGTHFRGQQVFRQFVLNQSHLTQGQRRRIVDRNR